MQGILCRVLESTIESPVGRRCSKILKTPRCRGFVKGRNIHNLLPSKFLCEAGVFGQGPKEASE